jgi:hypothetical protein
VPAHVAACVYDKRLVTDKMVQHWNMWRIFTVKNGPKTLSMLQIKPADWLFSAPLPPAAERWNTEDGGASRTGSGLGRLGFRGHFSSSEMEGDWTGRARWSRIRQVGWFVDVPLARGLPNIGATCTPTGWALTSFLLFYYFIFFSKAFFSFTPFLQKKRFSISSSINY